MDGVWALDRSGFTLLGHRSAVADFGDPDELERVYVPEALDLVRQVTGADEVTSVGWVIRRAGEELKGAPTHRWWYFPDMRADEALIFKPHDTDHSVAWRAPHTAFQDEARSGAHPRESVELRTVAFFY